MNSLKMARVDRFIKEKMELLKTADEEQTNAALEEIRIWEEVRRQISNLLGRVIIK